MALTFASGPADATDVPLLLDVWVNGFSIGKIGEFVLRDGQLLSRPAELSDLGFKISPRLAAGADGLAALAALRDIAWRIDQTAQILYVTAGNDALVPANLDVGGRASPGKYAVENGLGATFDYDISALSAGGRNAGKGLFDLRLFSTSGVASSGVLASAGGARSGSGTKALVRLDSTYALSDPSRQRRYNLGDFIGGGLAWTRRVRLTGAQITSDFSMQPDLITFPLPFVSGSAAVPSSLDVLVNGTKFLSQAVSPGPFEIPQLPVVSGAGDVTMTLTNALGKRVTLNVPFYASPALLAPRLQTWSAQAGAVRLGYGAQSNDYGSMAASLTYRRGLSSHLTVESSAEATTGAAMAGGGVVANLGNFAVLERRCVRQHRQGARRNAVFCRHPAHRPDRQFNRLGDDRQRPLCGYSRC